MPAFVIGIFAEPELPELLRWIFFYLFLFSVGYSVGPQFFGSLKKEALPQIVLAVVVAVSGLAAVIAMAMVFKFDEGISVGLLSGGMTQSAALGTGLNAIAGAADFRGREGRADGQRAARGRDHLRIRRSRFDPLSDLARTEDPARGSAGARRRRSNRARRQARGTH